MIEMMWIEGAEEAYIPSVESRLYAKHDVIDHEISVDDAQDEMKKTKSMKRIIARVQTTQFSRVQTTPRHV